MSNKSRLGMAVVLLIALVSTPAFAQTASSSITGVVIDSGGGFVPGATVVVKSESTGAEFDCSFDEQRIVHGAGAERRVYTVTVIAAGLQDGGPEGRHRHGRRAGDGSCRRSRSAASPKPSWSKARRRVIQTQSAAASTTINTKSITSLPVGSRSALDFAQFLPGVQTASSRPQLDGQRPAAELDRDHARRREHPGQHAEDDRRLLRDRQPAPRRDRGSLADVGRAGRRRERPGRRADQVHDALGQQHVHRQRLPLLPERRAQHEHLREHRVRGLPKGPLTLHQPGLPAGRPGRHSRRVRRPRQDVLLRQLRGDPPAEHDHDRTRRCCCRTRRTASSGTTAGLRAASTCMRWRRPTDSHVHARSASSRKLLQDIRNSTTSGGVLSEITRQPQRRTLHVPAAGRRSRLLPDDPHGLQPEPRTPLTGTWYRQRFTDTSFDTTNDRQPTWPGFPLYGTQGSFREAYTGAFRSTLSQNLVNEARVAYSGAPVEFGPYHNPDMYNGIARQPGRVRAGHQRGGRHHQRRPGLHPKRPQRDDLHRWRTP